jgi:hypothetical protein
METDDAPPPVHSPSKRTRVGSTSLEHVIEVGRETLRRMKKRGDNEEETSSTEDCRFREMFGVGIMVADALWTHLDNDGSFQSRSIEDMMRALAFMKMYAKEGLMSTMVGTIDEKTYRKRLWPMLEAIAALESTVVCNPSYALSWFPSCAANISTSLQIVWDNRFW